MVSYSNIQTLHLIMDSISCVLLIIGAVAGALAALRKNVLSGALACTGFLLLGLNILARLLLYQLIIPNYPVDILLLDAAYACIGNGLFITGLIAIIIALSVNGLRTKTAAGIAEKQAPSPGN